MIVNSELMSVSVYANKTVQERVAYICEVLELKNNFVVGRYQKPRQGAPYFLVRELDNPYSGRPITGKILDGTPSIQSIFCSMNNFKDLPYENEQLVLVEFTANKTKDIEKIEKGDLLMAVPGGIKPIYNMIDTFEDLEINIEEFPIAGTLIQDLSIGVLKNDIFQDVIKKKMDDALNAEQEKYNILSNEFDKKDYIINGREVAVKKNEKSVEEDKEKINKLLDDIHKKEQQLSKLGFQPENSKKTVDETIKYLKKPNNEIELVKAIQQQIALRGLRYDEDTIRKFYCTLKTNQLLILSGSSGTGKTSLVSVFSEVISAKKKIIPVQPSWTDKQDLIGFYNPIRRQYSPSLFLDALVEAEQDENTLHIICLDEINLAQIEYYLADVLSIREQKDAHIELYSKYEYDQSLAEIQWFTQKYLAATGAGSMDEIIKDKIKINDHEQFGFVQRYENLTRYPWSFKIPENVRIIGTMNIDGTVKPLSPKVIDRSFVLPIEKQGQIQLDNVKEGVFCLNAEHFKTKGMASLPTSLEDLNKRLEPLNAQYNDRVEKHLKLYTAAASSFNLEDKKLADELIMMKILPRINYLLSKEIPHQNFIKYLEGVTGSKDESYIKVTKMEKASKQTKVFSYWS